MIKRIWECLGQMALELNRRFEDIVKIVFKVFAGFFLKRNDVVVLAFIFGFSHWVNASESELELLKNELEAQRVQLKTYQEQIKSQEEVLNAQGRMLDSLVSRKKIERDQIGDLNPDALSQDEDMGVVRAASGENSLAIGGWIKNVLIIDSDAETQGAAMLPATFGLGRDDDDGQFSMDATMSRLFLEADGKALDGVLKGYIEIDLNNGNNGDLEFNLRHLYGSWSYKQHKLTAGQTWSTIMHLDSLPLYLTEPTVSGAVFARQAQFRWTYQTSDTLNWSLALEDANSSDVFANQPNLLDTTKYPDFIAALDYKPGDTRFTASGVVRDIRVDLGNGEKENETGWGLAFSSVYRPSPNDKLAIFGIYGQALGRYLLGILPIDGAAVDPVSNNLKSKDNWGAYGTWVHHWNDRWRSSFIGGHASTEVLDFQPGGALDNTQYIALNTFWSILPYLTIGVEYGYGHRENNDGSDLDNHRLMFGVQLF